MMRPRGLKDVSKSRQSVTGQGPKVGAGRVRGLRDLIVGQDIEDRATPANEAQRFTELVWLDRETDRLQREAEILEANLDRIRSRIAQIESRRQSILTMIRERFSVLGAQVVAQQSQRREASLIDESATENIHNFTFEY